MAAFKFLRFSPPSMLHCRCSRCSDYVTGWTTHDTWLDSRHGRFFFPPAHPDRLRGPPSLLFYTVWEGEAVGAWTWPLTTSSSEVTNEWCHPSNPTYVFMAWTGTTQPSSSINQHGIVHLTANLHFFFQNIQAVWRMPQTNRQISPLRCGVSSGPNANKPTRCMFVDYRRPYCELPYTHKLKKCWHEYRFVTRLMLTGKTKRLNCKKLRLNHSSVFDVYSSNSVTNALGTLSLLDTFVCNLTTWYQLHSAVTNDMWGWWRLVLWEYADNRKLHFILLRVVRSFWERLSYLLISKYLLHVFRFWEISILKLTSKVTILKMNCAVSVNVHRIQSKFTLFMTELWSNSNMMSLI